MNQVSDGEGLAVRNYFHNGTVEIKDFDQVLRNGRRTYGAIGCDGIVEDGGLGSVVFFVLFLMLVIFLLG